MKYYIMIQQNRPIKFSQYQEAQFSDKIIYYNLIATHILYKKVRGYGLKIYIKE